PAADRRGEACAVEGQDHPRALGRVPAGREVYQGGRARGQCELDVVIAEAEDQAMSSLDPALPCIEHWLERHLGGDAPELRGGVLAVEIPRVGLGQKVDDVAVDDERDSPPTLMLSRSELLERALEQRTLVEQAEIHAAAQMEIRNRIQSIKLGG